MANSVFRIKNGNTWNELTLAVELDGCPMDLSDVTAAQLLISAASVVSLDLTRGSCQGELFYRFSSGDFTDVIPPRFDSAGKAIPYPCELWLTFSDDTTAPVPASGQNFIVVEQSIVAS